MSIIHSTKQISPDLQDAIASFLANNKVTTATVREKPGAKARAKRRAQYMEKREREHNKIVDSAKWG